MKISICSRTAGWPTYSANRVGRMARSCTSSYSPGPADISRSDSIMASSVLRKSILCLCAGIGSHVAQLYEWLQRCHVTLYTGWLLPRRHINSMLSGWNHITQRQANQSFTGHVCVGNLADRPGSFLRLVAEGYKCRFGFFARAACANILSHQLSELSFQLTNPVCHL